MTANAASSKNALSVATAKGIQRNTLQNDSTTKEGAGRKPSPSPAQQQMDIDLAPIWQSLTPAKARIVFKRLGRDLGKSKHYTELCASYLRFLKAREEG